MKKFFTVLAVVILFSIAGRAPAAVEYSITDLGTLGGAQSLALSINNSGQIVGWANTSNGSHHGFLYSNGVMHDLGDTLGGVYSEAGGINDLGQIVGQATLPNGDGHAFLLNPGGSMIDLGTLGGQFSGAGSINNSGEWVGWSEDASGTRYGFSGVGTGPLQNLGTIDGGMSAQGNFSQGNGINNLGQITGESNLDYANDYAIFMNSSTSPMQDLGTLAGLYSRGIAINDSGEIVGYSYYANGGTNLHAFLYNGSGSLIDLGTFGGEQSAVGGINDLGQVVGDAQTGSGQYDAFLYSDGVMQDLNDLVSPSSGWTLTGASDINGNGWIIGQGINPDGLDHAFLLTPVPEPSTIALFLFGAGGVLLSLWRRPRITFY